MCPIAASHRKIPRKASTVATAAVGDVLGRPGRRAAPSRARSCTLSSAFISARVSAPQAATMMTQ